MANALATGIHRLAFAARCAVSRLDVLALFPLLMLVALSLGMRDAIVVTAFLLPALLALQAIGGRPAPDGVHGQTRPGEAGQEAVLAMLDRARSLPDHDTACILLQIDDWAGLVDRWGTETGDDIATRSLDRLRSSLRRDDCVERIGDGRFAVALHPLRAARLGVRDAIVTRLRAAMAEPLALAGGTIRLSVSVGHATLIRTGADPVASTFAAAEAALSEAHRNGPDCSRAYVPGLLRLRHNRMALAQEVEGALEAGEIRPWYQPQVALRTGAITGMEALARWHHPERGVLPPAEFLEAVDAAGRMDALGQTMLRRSLSALQEWDRAGVAVPTVSVNFSAQEFRDPGLADRIKWDLERFDLRPARLTVEILETVAAQGDDDVLMSTLDSLGAHGVRLDLDDFGIGQASLMSIRRFGVQRIKIDKSFIRDIDSRVEQQTMVAAILAMAHHLGVETLAEGIETEAVQAVLDKMGCVHAQGFLIARPMPFDRTIEWMRQRRPSPAVPTVVGAAFAAAGNGRAS